ncbi:hypothetical protein DACRYDRAFT_24892 [Dacryopinax primogenitus]|uniref:Uncharacterized protein n=1 Tax=Dacryopinax primogenitus (strain DJM 731) TaxID=1858805 RepID=M5G2J4_DACPD|nr:uncharacterized protein DACRYDRAFT_24892 [Dacryopinax primogenitus]EJT97987.1 hypothetical protein DACRYDRAFT_24892 [Dacryopinax primogenitus]
MHTEEPVEFQRQVLGESLCWGISALTRGLSRWHNRYSDALSAAHESVNLLHDTCPRRQSRHT